MNDRFTAQLRQHLLDTADERAADGALEAIDNRVAVTDQRIPLVARLTGDRDRIGAVSTAAVRYGLLAAALILAILAAALMATGARQRSTVFEGSWTVIDPADESAQVLFVSSGDTPVVKFVDDFATGDACVDDAAQIFTAEGTGTIEGDVLYAEFPDGGGCGLQTVGVGPWSYTYEQATDTIRDDAGLQWARVDRVVPPSVAPSRPPSPEPTANEGFVPTCVDLADVGSYSAPVGPLTATVAAPTGSEVDWQGTLGIFYLRISCSNGFVPVSINPSTATEVTFDTCVPQQAGEVVDFADAVARLSAPKVDSISGPIELTIDGHAAARFDVTKLSACAGYGLWPGTILGKGESGSIYVIDVAGELVAIEVNQGDHGTPAQLEEARGIVESMRFEGPAIDPASPAPSAPASSEPAAPSDAAASAAPAASDAAASAAPAASDAAASAAPAASDAASSSPEAASAAPGEPSAAP